MRFTVLYSVFCFCEIAFDISDCTSELICIRDIIKYGMHLHIHNSYDKFSRLLLLSAHISKFVCNLNRREKIYKETPILLNKCSHKNYYR